MKRLSVFIFFISLFLFLFSRPALAEVLLWDDFNDGNANDGTPVDWEEHIESQGQGAWWIEDGNYIGTIVKECDPDIPTFTLAGESDWDNYRFEVKLMGDKGIDRLILFRYHSINKTYAIKMISSGPGYGDSIFLLKNNLIYEVTKASFVNKQGIWYKLLIEAQDANIKVYINDFIDPIIDYTDQIDPNLTGKIGLLTWPGFYAGCKGVTTTRFDDILVCDFDEPCVMPSPTPTPTPTPPLPLLFLPGLGASWNSEALLTGMEAAQSEWHMIPFLHVYDGIIETLKNVAGEENFYIFYYDWRKPIIEISQDLEEFIEETVNPPPGTNINLVGHSLGGLVARAYIQESRNNHRVDQLITLGSPHEGIPHVYPIWEGADPSVVTPAWVRVAIGLILQVQKKNFRTNVEAIQEIAPVFQDLLPLFNYLKWSDSGEEINVNDMHEQNINLAYLKQKIDQELLDITSTILGRNLDTPRWLLVKRRDWFDKLLGRWRDGKPVSQESNSGDQTVLEISAQVVGANVVSLEEINHSDLVRSNTSQEEILNILGLSAAITQGESLPKLPYLVFFLASPAKLTVCRFDDRCIGEEVEDMPNAIYSPDDKLIFIPEAIDGDYHVFIEKQNEGGEYRLFVGQITEGKDVWTEFWGDTSEEETQEFSIDFDHTLSRTKKDLLLLAEGRLKNLKEDAKEKIRKPFSRVFIRIINRNTRHIKKALWLMRRNKVFLANWQIKKTIINLLNLEKVLKLCRKLHFITPEDEIFLTEKLREVRDYLLQALEIE